METALKPVQYPAPLERRLTHQDIQNRLVKIRDVLPVLREYLNPCRLCPRCCGSERTQGERGECNLGEGLRIASVACHYGEEPPISGDAGAINIFFSGCNLHCSYCQNWPISQQRIGRNLAPSALALRILKKWSRGGQTLNWVTPTAQIVGALEAYTISLEAGFNLPLVHNNGGYEDPEVIALLAGIVDIWLPDAKTLDSDRAKRLQNVADYPERNLAVIEAMVKHVRDGEARAVIVRHLVVPGGLRDSARILQTLWRRYGHEIYLSLMGQYFPTFHTIDHHELGRRLSEAEYLTVVEEAQKLGFEKGWVQEYDTETGMPLHCLR
jgi:putative pyruvate formate lyase activating enzyme